MHITRWLALAPTIALSAACTLGGGPPTARRWAERKDPLATDVALAALAQPDEGARAVWRAAAVVCQPTALSARPAEARQARAERLLALGQAAALMGDAQGARDLLRQAAYLDGTSLAVAYQLARASEVAGDTATAVREYCRYLSLGAGGAERAEVRERLLLLAPFRAVPAAASPVAAAPTHRPRRVMARQRVTPSGGTGAPATVTVAADPQSRATTSEGTAYDGSSDGAVATDSDEAVGSANGGDGADGDAAPQPPAPAAERRQRTVRDAAIGAVVGAAAGAVVSRDVKGAIIGAAAGGLLGAVLGRSAGSTGRP